MKESARLILIALVAFAVFIAAIIFIPVYESQYKITEVSDYKSDGGEYTVAFQQVGKPYGPFGFVNTRLVLKDANGKVLEKYDVRLSNDGRSVDESNVKGLVWKSDSVHVTLTALEQDDTVAALDFK